MAVNPNTPVYADLQPDAAAAVVDVDIKSATFDGGRTTAKARVVYVANGGTGGGGAVYGPDASGTPATMSPVLVAGYDGTNTRSISVGTSGAVRIGINGTTSWTGGTAADGVAAAAGMYVNSTPVLFNGTNTDRQRTAAASDKTTGVGLAGSGILGQYLTTLPTYTTGQFGTLAMSADGILWTVHRGGQTIATGQAAVGTTSTLVVAARSGRQKVTLTPTTSTVYYIGATGVTASTGLYVAAGAAITLDTAAAVYAVGSAALTVSYIEYY